MSGCQRCGSAEADHIVSRTVAMPSWECAACASVPDMRDAERAVVEAAEAWANAGTEWCREAVALQDAVSRLREVRR